MTVTEDDVTELVDLARRLHAVADHWQKVAENPALEGYTLTEREVWGLTHIPYETEELVNRTPKGLWAFIGGHWEWFTEEHAPAEVERKTQERDSHVTTKWEPAVLGEREINDHVRRKWAIYRVKSREEKPIENENPLGESWKPWAKRSAN